MGVKKEILLQYGSYKIVFKFIRGRDFTYMCFMIEGGFRAISGATFILVFYVPTDIPDFFMSGNHRRCLKPCHSHVPPYSYLSSVVLLV